MGESVARRKWDMDTGQRRGLKEQDESIAEQKTREREARFLAVQRLRENPDFAVLRDFLQAAIESHQRLLHNAVVSPQDQATHNFTCGVIRGLEFALTGAEKIELGTAKTP
jgi:hypothetical protein